jgi:eukaryotic-like serine/threonine-protein kinase
MTLNAGTNLGPYEITAHIGAGGMGEVYRARDSRLGRDVAIKVSAERFTERFDREARTVAALNHPNICTLHDVGPNYLVMELIAGPTLAERMAQGPVPVDEALEIARQIAAALGAAHDKGIIHRDLKPGNIKFTPDGTVKVLDFGLAKMGGTPPAASEDSPTISMAATQAGVILGTAAYMSPEQARGKHVDKGTDIWAFGVVLFEMLTGRRLYEGTDVTEILAAVIKEEPDWNRVPAKVRRLLRHCLEKDPKRRLHDIRDMDLLLEVPPASPAIRRALLLVTASLLAIALAVAAWGWLRASLPLPEAETVRFVVLPPEKTIFDSGVGAGPTYNPGSISPDGRKLAFTVRDSSRKIMLWVRPLDSLNAQPLAGTDGASAPFWSPDNRSIAFFADGKLKRIEAGGGPVQTLSDIAAPRGGAWSSLGVIVFTRIIQGPLYRVPASGGEVTLATTLGPLQRLHRSPSFLPDGDHFLYFAVGSSEGPGIFLGSLSGDKALRLGESDSGAVYATPGYLLFVRQGALMAQKFDLKRYQLIEQANTNCGIRRLDSRRPVTQCFAQWNIGLPDRRWCAELADGLVRSKGEAAANGGTTRWLCWSLSRSGRETVCGASS